MTTRPPASLGRRLLPAVLITTAASGLVALLDQPSAGSAIDLDDSSTVVPDQGAVVTAAPPALPTPQTPPTVSSTTPTTPTTAATTPPAVDSTTCEGQTIDGPTVDTRWGPVQVEAVVSATGQICDVDAIQSPDSHGRSVRINQQALPILHTQVMDAQSAGISGVSGATVTSVAYERSLQSILDNLG